MNDFQLEQQLIDEEIKKLRFENQLSAYNAQLFDKKRQLLECKKNQLTIEAGIQELNQKIVETKSAMGM